MVKKRTTEGTNNAPALNRRELLAHAAVVGAGAAMLVGTGAASAAPTGAARAQGTAPAGITWDYETDVLVCGAGNGGMSAALAAAEGGVKTLLLEISIQSAATESTTKRARRNTGRTCAR
jgi:alkyl hydroperoxide reductase subunit AhpF